MEIVRPEFETNKELKLNVIAAENVRQAMWWARFMAIVGFFVTGLLAVFALGCMIGGASWGYAMNSLLLQGAGSYGYDYMGAPFVILGVVYLIIAVISFFQAYFLYVAADKVRRALTVSDESLLAQGMLNLKRYFQLVGILTLIGVACMFLGVLIAIVTFIALA